MNHQHHSIFAPHRLPFFLLAGIVLPLLAFPTVAEEPATSPVPEGVPEFYYEGDIGAPDVPELPSPPDVVAEDVPPLPEPVEELPPELAEEVPPVSPAPASPTEQAAQDELDIEPVPSILLGSEEIREIQEREIEKRRNKEEVARLREIFQIEQEKNRLEEMRLQWRKKLRELRDEIDDQPIGVDAGSNAEDQVQENYPSLAPVGLPEVHVILGSGNKMTASVARPDSLPITLKEGDEFMGPGGVHVVERISGEEGVVVHNRERDISYPLPMASPSGEQSSQRPAAYGVPSFSPAPRPNESAPRGAPQTYDPDARAPAANDDDGRFYQDRPHEDR